MLTEPEITEIARTFEDAAPQDILSWAVRMFGRRVALACSFGGPTGLILIDMIVKIDPTIPIYYLDTGLLFPETYEHIGRVAEHYGIEPLPVRPAHSLVQQADVHGPALWERDPDLCCRLRKVEPQQQFLSGFLAWISGIRRDHSLARQDVNIVGWDRKFELLKINPLANWTEAMVWAYIGAHDVPYNPLHDRGYASIGCVTCTAPVAKGEDPRAGRWKGFEKTECGLHR